MTTNTPNTMNTTYITFGSTNSYQAQGNGLFRGRTRIAIRSVYEAATDASERLMDDCVGESDNYCISDDCSAVLGANAYSSIMQHGDMAYEHDGYIYESIAIEDLTEEDAKIAIRDGVLTAEDLFDLYAMYPALAPVEADEE
jgi:hypothetical protein